MYLAIRECRSASALAAGNAACDPCDNWSRHAYNAGSKAYQQPGRSNRDSKSTREFRQHTGRQKDGKTNDESCPTTEQEGRMSYRPSVPRVESSKSERAYIG